jgi:hypothetical protein
LGRLKVGEGTIFNFTIRKKYRKRKIGCILLVDDDEMVNCLKN